MFQWPGYISIGDEYEKRNSMNDRFKGKSFLTAPPKKGAGVDTLLGKKFLSLSEGDKYVDPGYYEKRYRMENEKKKLTPQGFRYTNNSKKPGGAGTYYGTFSESHPPKHEVEFAVTRRGETPDKYRPQPRNIVTNPPKKGTYGFPGVSLSRGDEAKYVSDPYEGDKRREALRAKENNKRIVGPPFKGACRKNGFFDETAHGVSKVYSIDKPLPAKKPTGDEKKLVLRTSWRPAGTLVAAITRPPEYIEDPYEAKEKIAREQRKKDRPATVWKPIGGTKSLPVKGIKFVPA